MQKFKIGQRVRFKNARIDTNLNGELCFIAEYDACDNSYLTDFPHPTGGCYWAFERNLGPVYDGDEKSTWSECAWKPKSLEPTMQ